MSLKLLLPNSVSIFGLLISTAYQVDQLSSYEAFFRIIFSFSFHKLYNYG